MAWSIALPHTLFVTPYLAVATPIATGSVIGFLVNRRDTKEKYRKLRQPPFYPPAWVFAPVWTVLYGLMGFASHHATVSASLDLHTQGLTATGQTLYTTQLAFNYLWMPLFFGLRRPKSALVDILLLGGNLAALMGVWWKTDRVAFWLMVPYAGWLSFATYLNASVGVLNSWTMEETKAK